jgi:hypothetical protein
VARVQGERRRGAVVGGREGCARGALAWRAGGCRCRCARACVRCACAGRKRKRPRLCERGAALLPARD